MDRTRLDFWMRMAEAMRVANAAQNVSERERLVDVLAAQRISRVFTDYDRQFLRGLRIAPEVK